MTMKLNSGFGKEELERQWLVERAMQLWSPGCSIKGLIIGQKST